MSEYPNKTHTLGRWFWGWCSQGDGTPVVDAGYSESVDGWSGGTVVVRLRSTPGRALFIGRKGSASPSLLTLMRVPVLGVAFRPRFNGVQWRRRRSRSLEGAEAQQPSGAS
jgi:hypothetical protein